MPDVGHEHHPYEIPEEYDVPEEERTDGRILFFLSVLAAVVLTSFLLDHFLEKPEPPHVPQAQLLLEREQPKVFYHLLPFGRAGQEYSFIISNHPGVTWEIVRGGLPPGLTLSSDGKIMGKFPKDESGRYEFYVRGTSAAGDSVEAPLAILLQ